MKITTEKLPGSLLALEIEIEKDRFERGLDQAARRISQKYPIPGFRPGKAPRFMIERTFGRDALVEEATDDLVNKAFRDALKQAQIEPVGPPAFGGVISADPFTFKVMVPIEPTVTLGDYRNIQVALEPELVSDEQVERMLEAIRDRHVVLQEIDEARPTQEGDQLRVYLETIVDGEPLEPRPEGSEPPEQNLDVVKGRLVDELYDRLIGTNIGDTIEVTALMPDDHANEKVRGKEITFHVEVLGMQQRLLPEWDEVPTLENFSGSLDELRVKTRNDLEVTARNAAERQAIDSFIEQLVAQADLDIPEVMIDERAESLLEDQEQQFARYGITLDQMLAYRGQTRDQAMADLRPEAERQTRQSLALIELMRAEELVVTEAEVQAELDQILLDYDQDRHAEIIRMFQGEMRNNLASMAMDKKLRARMLELIRSEAPARAMPANAEPAALEAAPAEAAEPSVSATSTVPTTVE